MGGTVEADLGLTPAGCTIVAPEMSFEYLLNADFDLSLRPRWQPPAGGSAKHRITDLAWHALFLAEPGDSVVVPEPAPGDFVDHLERSEIEVPALTVAPANRSDQHLSPFGWNAGAAARNLLYDTPVDHPPLDTVARVNGRRFSALLEDELFGGGHTLAEIRSEAELLHRLESLPDSPEGWILKAEHGNAGLGNRRFRTRDLVGGDLKLVRRLFDEDDVALLERWRPRLRDLCTTFAVTAAGEALEIGLHETVTTADGALIGALFEEDPEPLAEWRPFMAEAATAVAGRLTEVGYFGRACIDAFVWNDGSRSRLRPLVDLNARREMSAGASNLWRRLGGRGAAYWRFFNRRKLMLLGSYGEFEQALHGDAYDAKGGTGVLLTAPLWVGPDRRAPAKAAMLMLGRDRGEVFALDRRVRERLEK